MLVQVCSIPIQPNLPENGGQFREFALGPTTVILTKVNSTLINLTVVYLTMINSTPVNQILLFNLCILSL